MRVDRLAHHLDERRASGPAYPRPTRPAEELWKMGAPSVLGTTIAETYGLLAHFCTVESLEYYVRSGYLGGEKGFWRTPTAYAACMVPYNLGLPSPREVCLLVDVSAIPELWGPGTAPPSDRFPAIWTGGGIEFYTPTHQPIDCIREVIERVFPLWRCTVMTTLRPQADEVIARWEQTISDVLPKTDLPDRPVRGADGEGVVWIWREYMGEMGKAPVAQVIIRLKLGSFPDDVSGEIVATAWREGAPRDSWSHTYPLPDEPESATSALAEVLDRAWRKAHGRANAIGQVREAREDTVQHLLARNISVHRAKAAD